VNSRSRTYRRRSVPFLVAFTVAVCGSLPTSPSGSTQSSTDGNFQSPSANVHATGGITFPRCSNGTCTFSGSVTNDGPDCASNVRGITHLLDASGKELESQSWEILGRVRGGNTGFSGCCFNQSSVNAYRTHRTDVSFEPLPCI